jgi:hypothetical protein
MMMQDYQHTIRCLNCRLAALRKEIEVLSTNTIPWVEMNTRIMGLRHMLNDVYYQQRCMRNYGRYYWMRRGERC